MRGQGEKIEKYLQIVKSINFHIVDRLLLTYWKDDSFKNIKNFCVSFIYSKNTNHQNTICSQFFKELQSPFIIFS